ncbi:uncharacterized protein DEA37_0012000 [Paragonimus westermani]|uniref:Uncharacterized protein n=1 Tax=Paragonimus westermani TaxID=34504 RepID=A0A5J4NY28_9TREM|nr:uncharacterized protein DEA37_0012000 [Paragonimus westermani]
MSVGVLAIPETLRRTHVMRLKQVEYDAYQIRQLQQAEVSSFIAILQRNFDNGTEFQPALFRDFNRLLGIHQIQLTAYHLATNGLLKRPLRQVKANSKTKQDLRRLASNSLLVMLGIDLTITGDIDDMTAGTPLWPPYDGSFRVFDRKDKYFVLDKTGTHHSIHEHAGRPHPRNGLRKVNNESPKPVVIEQEAASDW